MVGPRSPWTMDLDQTLLLDPAHSYSVIQATLLKLGWEEAPSTLATPPLLAGEPEAAAFRWPGGRPLLGYSFNPVVMLRVLEAGEATPTQRKNIHAALGMKQLPHELLKEADPRKILLGIWGLGAIEAIEARPLLTELEHHTEAVVRQAATTTGAALDRKLQAREQVLLGLTQVAATALPLVSALGQGIDPRCVQPKEEDYDLVFAPELRETLKKGYAPLWEHPPNLRSGYPQVTVHAALAGLLRSANPLSWEFPGGYRPIAGFLEPGRTWLCWHYHSPGSAGVTYDGLVWQGERWIWFPKPWRVLERFFVERGIV